MANILYGVNGEGSGHSTRSKEVIQHLLEQGHRGHVVSFDRGLRNLSADFEVTEINGLRFAYVKNQVRYRKTVIKNLLTFPSAARSFKKILQLAEQWDIQLVCTDFEPLSYHVGHHKRLPVISIDNQHALTHARLQYPKKYRGEALTAKLVTRLMIPDASEYLITAFFPAQLKRKHALLLPPILRKEVLSARASEGQSALVYVTSPSEELAGLLKRVRHPFVCYGFGREDQDGNLVFKKPSLTTFLEDLAGCRAVIANSGFSLICEALYLGKPYLAIPVRHQFEQILNAYYLDKLGYGAYWDELSKERIESFLFNLDLYRENLKRYPRQDNSALFDQLDKLIRKYTG
ncbi:MAG TPA: glycosyltransferase family protein [Terriglobales bacterium]|nr:glycosyltransferase family protein [Terriglobales bacterium]